MKTFLNLSRTKKKIVAAAADFVFLPLVFLVAILLRYDKVDVNLLWHYKWLLLAAPLVSLPIFMRLGLYRAVIRYVDQKVVSIVVLGVTLSVGMLLAGMVVLTQMQGFSRGAFGIYWISAIAYMVTSRFVMRGYLLRASGLNAGTRVAIYGAGRAGMQLANALRSGRDYQPVAFLDDSPSLQGALIAGLRVRPSESLPELIANKQIKEVLLAMPSQSKSQQKQILEKLEPLKIKIKVTPRFESLVNGELRVQDVRDIGIEDLLGRDPVAPNMELITRCITDKTVLVTGAGGSIGSELCRQIIRLKPSRLLLLEMTEFALYVIQQELQEIQKSLQQEIEIIPFLGSVNEQEKCERILTVFKVETIYHAAAYKHVPLVEHNPIEGVRNNVLGTLSIARAAMNVGVESFVLISTDKAVRPTNVMGATKRWAELILQAFSRQESGTRFCMVRFGNVLGSSGSVVPRFSQQIMAGGPITLTHPDITRYFMTIPEAAQLVLQAGAMGQGGDVFVLDMGEPVKIADLARRMIHLSGLEVTGEKRPDLLGEEEKTWKGERKADSEEKFEKDTSIAIEHVGLRPGEKLYEELLIGENVEGTEHPLIMRAQETEHSWPVLQDLIRRLEIACDRFDCEEVRKLLHEAVTEYNPQCGIEDHLWRMRCMDMSDEVLDLQDKKEQKEKMLSRAGLNNLNAENVGKRILDLVRWKR